MLIIQGREGEMKTKLQERNREAFLESQKQAEQRVSKMLESFKISKAELVDLNRVGLRDLREKAEALHQRMDLQEATSALTYGQLLRAGVQNQFNDIYKAVEVTYQAIVREVSSNKRQEFYAPLERIGFPKRVTRGSQYSETGFKGVDKEVINEVYGMLLSIERTLIDDDQTGQVVQEAQQMAENTRIHEEAYVWARIANLASSLDGEALPVSDTYSTVYADATAGGIHGNGNGVNALSSARISQTQLQNGMILAKKMKDQSGRPIVVDPKLLAISPQDMFYAEVLMGSDYNPSMSSTASGDKGLVGGGFSKNPIKGLYNVVVTRFLPDYSAILADSGKGFVFQRRDATEVIQENPQSGPAFSQDVFRYKVRGRWQADFIDPKFFINLNPSFSAT